jgi:acyl carrier protein
MTPLVRDVKAFIVSALREPLAAVGYDGEGVPDDLDLRTSGVVDSLGFIQLIAQLEARFGCAIDLSELAPEELTNLGALSRHVASQVPPGASPWVGPRAVSDRPDSRVQQRRISTQ